MCYNSFNGMHFKSDDIESNLSRIEQRKIYNSNSDYLDNNISHKNNIRKNLTNFNLNNGMNINTNNSIKSMEEINLYNNPYLKLYSIKRKDEHNITDINMDINKEKNKKLKE